MTLVWKQLLPQVCLVLAVVAVCERGGAETAEDRWNSRDRGRVVFAGVIDPAPALPDTSAICVLHLPACSLEVHPFYGDILEFILPAWGPDRESLYYGTYRGVVRHNLQHGTKELTFPAERRKHEGRVYTMTVIYEPDSVKEHNTPGVSFGPIAYGSATVPGSHYYGVRYVVDPGPPRWRVSPDSLVLPSWADQRVREKFSEDLRSWYDSLISDTVGSVKPRKPTRSEVFSRRFGFMASTPQWCDVVRQDPLGNVSLVLDLGDALPFGLTLTSKGDLLATWRTFVDRPNSALICDLTSGDSIVPEFPDDPVMAHLRFSPNGDVLAAAVYQGAQPGTYICRAPDFSSFERLDILHDSDPIDLCWSPDGEWLLVHAGDTTTTIAWPDDTDDSTARTFLVAVELETLAEVRIPWPFQEDGEPSRWHIGGGLDWID